MKTCENYAFFGGTDTCDFSAYFWDHLFVQNIGDIARSERGALQSGRSIQH